MRKSIKRFLGIASHGLALCCSVALMSSLTACFKFGNNSSSSEESSQDSSSISSGSISSSTVIDVEISFPVAEKALMVGESEYLFPEYKKIIGFTLAYTSSNPSIVSVDADGKISAESEGSAVITATYSDGNNSGSASLTVNSSFGGYLPELKTMGVANDMAITVDGDYVLQPYVVFNGKHFYDAELTYSIADNSIAEVSASGEITAKAKGKTLVTIEAAWRGKDKISAPTLKKVIELSVIDDVRFFNGTAAVLNESLYTLAEFDGVSYKNSVPCDFKVIVNGEEYAADVVVEDESIVTMQGGQLVGVGFGSTEVTVQKEVTGDTYSKTFVVDVVRVEKTVTDTIPLFSTMDGSYLDIGTKEKKTVLSFIGVEDEAVDAYQKSRALTVSEGKVLGVTSSSLNKRGSAEISVGTSTVLYHFNMETLAKAISVPEDLKALQLSGQESIGGYFEMMNDIDATGVSLAHNTANGVAFAGVFDGKGHVISNLSLAANSSMFGVMEGTAIAKNFALTNLYATKAYFLAQNTNGDGLTIEDVYVQISESTQTPRGITGRTGASSVCKNVVIEYLGENAEKNRDYSERWVWQGLIGGMWTYESEGMLYAQDKKWSNVYVISPFVVSFRSDDKKDGDDYAAVYGYGANETADIYGASLTQGLNHRDNPNLGDYWQTTAYYNAKYTNLYHYSSYAQLAAASQDFASFENDNWVVYGGRVYWKSLFGHDVTFEALDGNTIFNCNTRLKDVGKELTFKAYMDGNALADNVTVTVENNSYVSWNNARKALRVNALPTSGEVFIKVTVSVTLGGVTIQDEFVIVVASRIVTPIQPGGDFNVGNDYDKYYENVVPPIEPGGDYDADGYENGPIQ